MTQTILRVDYDNLPAPQMEQRPELSDRMRDHFPIATGNPVGTLMVNFSPTGSGIQQQITGKQWEHRKADGGTKILFFTPDHLSLEYGQGDYDHFPPFLAEFEIALNALIQIYPDIQIKRIGLRYVNQIQFDEGNPLDWEAFLAPDLVNSVKAGIPEGAALARSMHQLHLRHDNLDLLCHYGISNPEYPATVSRREFILDFDCFRSEVVPNNEVLTTITRLNVMCEAAFERSILENLRTYMEPIQ